MKQFTFPLERVLAWRRIQSDRERAILEKLSFASNALLQREQAARAERTGSEEAISGALHFDAYEVATLPQYQARVVRSLTALAAEQQQMQPRIAQQQVRIRDAERQVKLLERLREHRMAAWETERSREEEAFAAEAYLARCIRLRRGNSAGA